MQEMIDKMISELLFKHVQGPVEAQKELDKGESTNKHRRCSKFEDFNFKNSKGGLGHPFGP